MLFLFFLYLANSFFEITQIDKIIYTKLSTIEIDSIRELIKIVILVMFYSLYKNINSYLFL